MAENELLYLKKFSITFHTRNIKMTVCGTKSALNTLNLTVCKLNANIPPK